MGPEGLAALAASLRVMVSVDMVGQGSGCLQGAQTATRIHCIV